MCLCKGTSINSTLNSSEKCICKHNAAHEKNGVIVEVSENMGNIQIQAEAEEECKNIKQNDVNSHTEDCERHNTGSSDMSTEEENILPNVECIAEVVREDHVKDECSDMVIGECDSKIRIMGLIGRGSFGKIYKGECLSTHKTVAIKAEKQRQGYEKVLQEGNVYYRLQGGPGIPEVYWYGMHGSSHNFLVMELLGPNLNDVFNHFNNRFSLQTVLKFVIEALAILKHIHNLNYIHRDISPYNLVTGRDGNQHKIYLIDMGLAKKCNTAGKLLFQGRRNSFSLKHPMVGTPLFVSLAVHQGTPDGRKDDLESLAYICIYFLKGSLPWQRCSEADTNQTNYLQHIEKAKLIISPEKLCSGIPEEFTAFLTYCRQMRPTDIPDYEGLVRMFRKTADYHDIDLESAKFDWVIE